MRVCWISSLLLALFHAASLQPSSGLEGGKKIGVDDVYKPRKWSQVRDGPYRMVVSSRDQESNETQPDSRKATRNRQSNQQYKQLKTEVMDDASDKTQDSSDAVPDSSSDVEDSKLPSRALDKETDDTVVHKPRTVDRRKHKIKFDQVDSPAAVSDDYEKSTQRTITKLARKRERILSNENFRKAHRISLTDTHYSTAHPSTISHKLYNHFRPVDRGIPRESIIPFFDFGKKLSTGKPPNAINSIEGSSTPGLGALEITTRREDDDLFHEDMDVSIVKHKPVEWNSPPRARPPSKNSELTSYFRTGSNRKNEEHSARPTARSEDITTTRFPGETLFPVEPSITIPTTMLPPEVEVLDSPRAKSKAQDNASSMQEIKKDSIVTEGEKSALIKSDIRNNVTQLPHPSPTAKILSTAVVTSVSVKEIYKHSKTKELNLEVEEIPVKQHNVTGLKFQELKDSVISNATAESNSSNAETNQTHRIDKSLSVITQSPHKPLLERLLSNKTWANLKNNSSIRPTTIRPKFRSNVEYHTFTTKVPIYSTTFKPVNRSLYSTSQREQQKIKLNLHQHIRTDNNKTLDSNQTVEETASKTDARPVSNLNENKTKMYLTIRSRIPNQAAIYRNTFKRNATKPLSPVLRVIATPSSYIEVPKIISWQNTTTTLTSPTETPLVEATTEYRLAPSSDNAFPNTDTSTITTLEYHTSPPSLLAQSETSPRTVDSTRETRMNNHRMPKDEPTDVQEPGVEPTTEVIFHSLDTTTETPAYTGPSSSRPVVISPKESIDIVTVGPRIGTAKPKLPWVYLGHKNRTRSSDSPSVQAAQWSGFGIAAYVLAALGIIPLVLGALILLRQILIKGKKKMLDESEYSSEYNRTPLPTKLPRITSHIMNWEGEKSTGNLGTGQQSSTTNNAQHQASHHQPAQHPNGHHQNNQATVQLLHQTSQNTPSLYLVAPGKWEFPRDKLRLQTLLGEGNFGQVWKAEADDISGHEGLTRLVAVKTVKEGSGGREREDLLRELAIMKELGSHPNVVTLLGCCTDREPFLLIMEYVMYGKMLTFLREHRTRAHYFNFSDLNSALVSRDLTVFAYCVARGMEFLVSKGIIHRDLAARNILVDHNKLCKIADFGMSRNVRDTGEIYEQRPNRGALPIRWMAPEALHCSVFTHKSDVWSFGILVWEIITLGCTPYQTMGAREVMRRVREGYRLERPVHCSQELYKVITRCWAGDASKRPNFTELKHDLATLLSDPQTNGAYVDLDALTEEMSSHSC